MDLIKIIAFIKKTLWEALCVEPRQVVKAKGYLLVGCETRDQAIKVKEYYRNLPGLKCRDVFFLPEPKATDNRGLWYFRAADELTLDRA